MITTTHAPNSSSAQEILQRILAFRNVSSTKYKVSAHLLYLAPDAPENPNAFLNLARAFSQTRTVTLFPSNLSVVPPKSFLRSISSSSPLSRRKPVIFVAHGQISYPFTTLSPLLTSRDGPTWCTERFFPTSSRSADWSECLWQFWLENYGVVETRLTTDWLSEKQATPDTSSLEVSVVSFGIWAFIIVVFADEDTSTTQQQVSRRNLCSSYKANRCCSNSRKSRGYEEASMAQETLPSLDCREP